MRLHSLIAGVFGVFGFLLSIIAGLLADNSTESILLHAMLFAVICYVVGYGVGLVGQQVATEHAQRLAAKVAQEDAAAETDRLQKAAELDAQNAGRAGPDPAPATPPGTPQKA